MQLIVYLEDGQCFDYMQGIRFNPEFKEGEYGIYHPMIITSNEIAISCGLQQDEIFKGFNDSVITNPMSSDEILKRCLDGETEYRREIISDFKRHMIKFSMGNENAVITAELSSIMSEAKEKVIKQIRQDLKLIEDET